MYSFVAQKQTFSKNSIAENKDNSYLWQHVKDLSDKASSPKLPDELITDEGTSSDPNIKAEKLNCFFANL